MPNWCENRLVVKGEKADLILFQTKVKGTHATYTLSEAEKEMYKRMGESEKNEEVHNFTFNSLVPVPQEVLEAGFNGVGYNWQSENWGTKWDIHGANVMDESDEEVIYSFDTAWAPPEPWVKQVSALFPKLTFELAYFEPGMMFAGYMIYQNDEVIDEEHVSDSVDALKMMMVEKLGYSEEEVNEYWYDEEDEEEIS